MDAVRLVEAGLRALAQAHSATDVMAEAWQTQALAQAVGVRLALDGPPRLRAEAHELAEAGGRGSAGADHASLCGKGGLRSGQLTRVLDTERTLRGLAALLDEVGIALVAVAGPLDDEALYWQCMEAIDAAADSCDRVAVILRRLPADGRDGPSGVPGGEQSGRREEGPAGASPVAP
jgi:hypothetical protein